MSADALLPSPSPRSLKFRMPAEWEPHAATWLAWPHNASDWPGKFQPIPWVYAEIVRHLSRAETVHLLVDSEAAERRAAGQLRRAAVAQDRVRFHRIPTNRVWLRDSGPIFVTAPAGGEGNELGLTDWRFNAWAKYDDWALDDRIPEQVAQILGVRRWTPCFPGSPERRVVLEGGSIDANGAGLLLTTEECLLGETQQRNPGAGRSEMEQAFHDCLGVDRVLWLGRGIAGDDTHGHVDDIARFVAVNTIVAAVEPDRSDENHLPLAENLDRLKSARNLDGRPFEVVELPMPSPVFCDGQRLPASYANFYIANGRVLVPTFNDSKDRIALNTLAGLFPERSVVGIYCRDLVWGLGTLHCMTQQQPEASAPATAPAGR